MLLLQINVILTVEQRFTVTLLSDRDFLTAQLLVSCREF